MRPVSWNVTSASVKVTLVTSSDSQPPPIISQQDSTMMIELKRMFDMQDVLHWYGYRYVIMGS